MQLIQSILTVLACFSLVTIPGIEANKIKRNSVIPFFVDYSEVSDTLPLPQRTSAAVLTNDAEVSGFLESFVYTRPIYDQAAGSSVRQAVGSATYNVVLNYVNTNATGTDPCWKGSYTSLANFPYGNGRLSASFSGSIEYLCPFGSPASEGTDSFVTYVSAGKAKSPPILPLATSPILKGGSAVNIYTGRKGRTETQKISNVQVWDRQAEFANNCNFSGVGNFTGCLTEYVLDTRGSKIVSKPPKGFPGEGVRI